LHRSFLEGASCAGWTVFTFIPRIAATVISPDVIRINPYAILLLPKNRRAGFCMPLAILARRAKNGNEKCHNFLCWPSNDLSKIVLESLAHGGCDHVGVA
jgi:hypothetical protein